MFLELKRIRDGVNCLQTQAGQVDIGIAIDIACHIQEAPACFMGLGVCGCFGV